MNESEITKKHLEDLAKRSYERGYTVFSDFLNLNEISMLSLSKPVVPYRLYGGYDNAERCVAAFGDGDTDFPIVCIRIEPANKKFADKLTHRDFLGSLMNLGINRSKLGDILIKDNIGYLFCLDSIAPYICENLTRIKHTTVVCKLAESLPEFANELPEVSEINVSSLRTDAVISAVYKLSRSEASRLFAQEKVFINAVALHKEGTVLKDGDRVSVRGYGRFIFEKELRRTKKDRAVVAVRKFV